MRIVCLGNIRSFTTRATRWNVWTIYKTDFQLARSTAARYFGGEHPWNDVPPTPCARATGTRLLCGNSADGNARRRRMGVRE